LDREWANYHLARGGEAERAGRQADARRSYRQAMRKAPWRLRPYTRWLRSIFRGSYM
jgi:predicted RNA polymerase sigma factor